MRCGDYQYELLPDGTAEITDYMGCDDFAEIPEALDGHPVVSIADGTFDDLKFPRVLVLPDSLRRIEDNPFSMNYDLAELAVRPGNPAFRVENHALLSRDGTCIFAYPIDQPAEEYTVPDGVQVIGSGALRRVGFRRIHLPQSLREIESYAFSICYALERIEIPEGVRAIGKNALSSCYKLCSVTLPNSLETLDPTAFYECSELKEICISPDHPRFYLKDGALFCRNGERIWPPENEETSKWKSEPAHGSGTPADSEEVSYNFEELPDGTLDLTAVHWNGSDLVFPAEWNGRRVSKISWIPAMPDKLFETAVVPEGVEELSDNAFMFCSLLRSVSLPESLRVIGKELFREDPELRSIRIPGQVKAVKELTFLHCSRLESAELPNGLECIETSAFAGCLSLTGFRIPDTVRKIGDTAFLHCHALTEIDLPDGLETLGRGAFVNCGSLRSVRLGKDLREVPDLCFFRCPSLSEVTLPEGLVSIGSLAFSECSSLRTLRIPASVTQIAPDAFTGCDNLTIEAVPASHAALRAAENNIPHVAISGNKE